MKRRVLALTLCMVMALSVTACGDKKNSVEGTETVETTETAVAENTVDLSKHVYNASEWVTLCDYNAIPLTITGDYEVEEQDAVEYFEQMFTNYGPFYKDDETKTVIEEGSIVKVNYTGYLNGEAFEGGAAENQLIDVTNNSSTDGMGYIDGFTAGLMGHSVGETVDCDVTFPENYGNADLAGQAVVFTFDILAIEREMTLEEVDDAFAQEQFQAETVEDMYADILTFLQQSAESTKSEDTYTALQNYLIENCTVEIPEDYLEDKLAAFINHFVDMYCGGDETQLETMLSTYYGYTVEEANEMWREGIRQDIQIEFILLAIAEKEGFEFDEEGYNTYISNFSSYNGYSDVSQLYEDYGYGDAVYGENYMKNIYVANLAMDKLKEEATVTVEPVSAE